MKIDKKKIWLLCFLLFICIIGGFGCGKKTKGLDTDYYTEGYQDVLITIDYKSNFLLAKEAMDIYIDNHKFYTVSNGDSNTNEYKLTKGIHVLKVASGTYHYASEEFEVKNTGDYFSFSIKNRVNSVELSFLESGNQYELLGQAIPKTVDDSNEGMTDQQIKAAKTNRTIWSYIWELIKAVLTFLACAVVLFLGGVVLKGILDVLKIRKIGFILVFVGICLQLMWSRHIVVSVIFPIAFLTAYQITTVKTKNIPKAYMDFNVIQDDMNTTYEFIFGIFFAALFAGKPEILNILPFTIYHIEWYMAVYAIVALLYVLFLLDGDFEYPEKVKQFVYEKGSVSEEQINEFVMDHTSVDASEETVESAQKRMIQTLDDLVRIGAIEKDGNGKYFR